MKVLKALLAVLTALAVALTAALLFIQDKNRTPLYPDLRERAVSSFSDTKAPGKRFAPLPGAFYALCCFGVV